MGLVQYSDDDEGSRSPEEHVSNGASKRPPRPSGSQTSPLSTHHQLHSARADAPVENASQPLSKHTKPPAQGAGSSILSIIRRTVHHPAPRTPLSGMDDSPSAIGSTARPDDQWQGGPGPSSVTSRGSITEEEAMITELLRPPAIPGVEDYGIPPPSTKSYDPALEAKLRQFQVLKHQGKHFNDSLMSNKAFRNPHIYAKLVEFVDVDETGTKFPKHIWDPFDVRPEWYADEIAASQKARSRQLASSQSAGKRTHIDFSSSSSAVDKGAQRSRTGGLADRGREGLQGHARHHPYSRGGVERAGGIDHDKGRQGFDAAERGDNRDRRKESASRGDHRRR